MPGSPDARFGLSDVIGSTDEGLTVEDRINELNAALRTLGAAGIWTSGFTSDDYLRLRDQGAASGERHFELATDSGITSLRAYDDIFNPAAILQTFFELDHATGRVDSTGEDWHVVGAGGEPAFEHGWVSGAAGATPSPAFYRHLGRVYLRGAISHSPAAASIAFTLPAGYRPSAAHMAIGFDASGAPATMLVSAAGSVYPPIAAQSYVVLDGISFRAEA